VFPTATVRGGEVTLFGSNFSSNKDSNDAYVSGRKATVLEATTTSLKLKVPPDSVTGDLEVFTTSGQSNRVPLAIFPDPGGYVEP